MQAEQKSSAPVLALRVIFTAFLAGTVLFIFCNSSEIGAVSSGKSQTVTAWLNAGMARLGMDAALTEGTVRKLGHFAEYALLGFWLMLTLRVYTRRILAFVSWPLLGGLSVAVLDEFYQTMVPGRSGRVTDVIIDFAGVLLGLCAALFLQLLAGAVRHSFAGRASRQPVREGP